MALTDPSGDIEAKTTDTGRELIARAILGDVVFRLVGFGVGRGGYDPSDPVQIIAIDQTDTALMDKVFPDNTADSAEAFQLVEEPGPSYRVYNCRLPATVNPTNADYGLGEIGLYGEILNSITNPSEIGEIFLFAIGHFPIQCKTRRDVFLKRVVVSY